MYIYIYIHRACVEFLCLDSEYLQSVSVDKYLVCGCLDGKGAAGRPMSIHKSIRL